MPPKPLHHNEIIKRLKRLGFQTISQKGSHLKLRKIQANKKYTVIVPIHSYDISVSVLHRILQQAGIDWDDFDSVK